MYKYICAMVQGRGPYNFETSLLLESDKIKHSDTALYLHDLKRYKLNLNNIHQTNKHKFDVFV